MIRTAVRALTLNIYHGNLLFARVYLSLNLIMSHLLKVLVSNVILFQLEMNL